MLAVGLSLESTQQQVSSGLLDSSQYFGWSQQSGWPRRVLRFPTLPVHFPKLLWAIPCAPISIGITVTLMFHSSPSSLTKSRHLSLFSLFFYFYSAVSWNGKIHSEASSPFFLWGGGVIITRSDLLTEIFISKFQRIYHYYYSLRVLHISVCRWSSNGVWVTTSVQDSSQYSGLSQQYCSLNCLHSSFYFQVPQSLYQSFGDCTKCINYNSYNRYFHVPQFFQFSSKVQVLILLFAFFQFCSVVSRDWKIHNPAGSHFFVD